MNRRLSFHDIEIAAGIATNLRPIVAAGKFALIAQNFDGAGRFQCMGKVPGSNAVSADHGSAVLSLHYFEFLDYDGTRKRQVLSVDAANTIQKIDLSSGALTTLTQPTGNTLVGEAMAGVKFGERFYLTSAGQITLNTGGLKWNGTNLREWGVEAPGINESNPASTWAMDDFTDWTDSTDATSSDSAVTKDGAGSVAVAKDDTNNAAAYIEITGQSGIDLSGAGQDLLYVWLFVPPGEMQSLTGSATCVEVKLTDADTDTFTAPFTVGSLVQGWNLLSMDLTDSDLFGGTFDSSDIAEIRLTLTATTAGTTWTGFLWDHIHTLAEGRLTSAVSNTDGNLIGDYRYRVTFLNEDGSESNAGPAAPAISPAKIAATAVLTLDTNPGDGEIITIDGRVYTWETGTLNATDEINVAVTASLSLDNLVDAINLTGTPGQDYDSAVIINASVTAVKTDSTHMTITARTSGTAGNSIDTTTDMGGGANAWAAGTMAGGTDGGQGTLTAIPTTSDTAVVARRIYRDLNADAVYRFLTQIDDNDATTYTDNIADLDLGTSQPPLPGDAFIDNSPPEVMRAVARFNGRLWGIVADSPNVLALGDVQLPEAWRLVDQFSFEEELTALKEHAYGLMVYGTDKTWVVSGDGVSSPIRIEEQTGEGGANGFRSVTKAKNLHFVMRETQAFLVQNPADPWLISQAIQDKFDALTIADLDELVVIHDRSRTRVLFLPKAADEILVWQYGTHASFSVVGDGSGVDPLDLRNGMWLTLKLPTGVDPRCAEMVESAADTPELWVGGDDGYVYHLQDTAKTTYATAAATEAINAIWESASLPLGIAPGGRGEPRYLEVNMETTAETVWTIEVQMLSGPEGATVGASNSFTHTFVNGNSTAMIPIPKLGERSEWCQIKLSQNTTTGVGIIRGLRLYYIPRGTISGARSS